VGADVEVRVRYESIDEDLSAMYLSAKKVNEPRDTHDHQELELLLESFSKQVEEIMSEVDTIVVSAYTSVLHHTQNNSKNGVTAFPVVKYSINPRDCRADARL
jgi:hypothetical protein